MTILSANATDIATKRYLNPGEDWLGGSQRVGHGIGKIERLGKYGELFSEIIYNLEFLPGGRILRNTGRQKGSLYNCFVLPCMDSIEEIGQFIKEALIVWSGGGGVGVNMSHLRPKGFPIIGNGGFSSGPISFLMAADSAAACIESGGQRRAAGLAMMMVNHPDIERFIRAKIDDGVLRHFNISVGVTEDFLDAVETQKSFKLEHNKVAGGSINAKTMWESIITNMVEHAEPGLLNWDNISKNNSSYFAPIECCNPCGEAILEKWGVCNLGSIVLPKFVANVNTNWKRMEEVIRLGVRFLDDVIEANYYTLPEFDRSAHAARRIGLGIMGLADYLFAKRIKYGSPSALKETEKLMRFVRDISYDESVRLATEKGAFPKFDPYLFKKAKFVRQLPTSMRMNIGRNGIRNVTLNAIAPTGTISLLPEVSPSIEPLMAKAYVTNDQVGRRLYVDPRFREFVKQGKTNDLPEWLVDTYDLQPEAHLDTQVVVQRFTDGAVSKCVAVSTRLSTKIGQVEIGSLCNERRPDTFADMKNTIVASEVGSSEATQFYSNGTVQAITVRCEHGNELTGSAVHRIKTLDCDKMTSEWKTLGEIRIGDLVLLDTGRDITDTGCCSTISSIVGREFIAPKNCVKRITVPKRLSKKLLWLLGCLFADGHLQSGSWAVSLGQELKDDVAQLYEESVKDLFGLEVRRIRDKRRKNFWSLTVNSKELYYWLTDYIGFTKDAVPEIVFRSGSAMKRSFIEGCTLDGHVSDTHVCIKTDKNPKVISDLNLLAQSIGIPTYCTSSHNTEYDKDYHMLFVQSDGIMSLSSFVFPEAHKQARKNELLSHYGYYRRNCFAFAKTRVPVGPELLETARRLSNTAINCPRLYSILHGIYCAFSKTGMGTIDSLLSVFTAVGHIPKVLDSGYIISRVVDKAETIETLVDIEVENEHSYISNGFISHNTINLPKGTTADKLSGLLLEYIHDVKGVTAYVDESRPNQPIKKVDVDLAVRMILDGTEDAIIGMGKDAVKCATGTCEI